MLPCVCVAVYAVCLVGDEDDGDDHRVPSGEREQNNEEQNEEHHEVDNDEGEYLCFRYWCLRIRRAVTLWLYVSFLTGFAMCQCPCDQTMAMMTGKTTRRTHRMTMRRRRMVSGFFFTGCVYVWNSC